VGGPATPTPTPPPEGGWGWLPPPLSVFSTFPFNPGGEGLRRCTRERDGEEHKGAGERRGLMPGVGPGRRQAPGQQHRLARGQSDFHDPKKNKSKFFAGLGKKIRVRVRCVSDCIVSWRPRGGEQTSRP